MLSIVFSVGIFILIVYLAIKEYKKLDKTIKIK